MLGASGDAAVGEVHLLAGGVSDALYGGKSTDDALDKLRAAKPTRFRVEQRLPNPADGDLDVPGCGRGDAGEPRARAPDALLRGLRHHLPIEVWRGNENARVDYKRGEINGVTVGGIDAPERLAEVMQWSSGNYRIIVQPLKLPAVAPKRPQAAAAAPAKVPAPAPSAQAARHSSATKTIFGMPAAEIIKARAAAEAAKAAAAAAAGAAPARPTAPTSPATPATTAAAAPASRLLRHPRLRHRPTPAPAPAPAPAKVTPPGVAPSAVPAPVARASASSATKTIFGVPAPGSPGGYTPVTQPSPAPSARGAHRHRRSLEDRRPQGLRARAGGVDDARRRDRRSGCDARRVRHLPRRRGAEAALRARSGDAEAGAGSGSRRRPHPRKPASRSARRRSGPTSASASSSALAMIGIYQLVGLLAH